MEKKWCPLITWGEVEVSPHHMWVRGGVPSSHVGKRRCPLITCGEEEVSPHHMWGRGGVPSSHVGERRCPLITCGEVEVSPHHMWGSGGVPSSHVGKWRCPLITCGEVEVSPHHMWGSGGVPSSHVGKRRLSQLSHHMGEEVSPTPLRRILLRTHWGPFCQFFASTVLASCPGDQTPTTGPIGPPLVMVTLLLADSSLTSAVHQA